MRTINLCRGKGVEGESHCVMAATSVVAGTQFTDHPKCVCPVITEFLIIINDGCHTDEVRNRLLGHLPWLIIGTNDEFTNKSMQQRAELLIGYFKLKTNPPRTMNMCLKIAHYSGSQAIVNAENYSRTIMQKEYEKGNNLLAIAGTKAWEEHMKGTIDFLEKEIIPVYHTMPIEPNYDIPNLMVQNANN